MFRNRSSQDSQQRLTGARWRLSFVPSAGQRGLDFACCSRGFCPWAEESRDGRIYRLPYSIVSSRSFRKDWLCCIRLSILLFCKGSYLFLEPYYPYPQSSRKGARLSRTDVPIPQITSDFIRREFPALVGRVQALSRRKARAQASGTAERKAYVGALKPLVHPESSLTTSRDGGGPSIVYSWWRHFLLDCGYPPDAALSDPILPGRFNNNLWREWERHIWHSIARVGPIEFISQVESGTTLLDFWSAVVDAGDVVKIPPEKVVLLPTFSPAPGTSFITLTAKQKQNASYNRKRRASKGAGPLQLATRGRPSRPSPLVGAASRALGREDSAGAMPRDDVNLPADDDYNPTFDGTPSPNVAGLPQASPTEKGYASAGIIAGEGVEHPDATTSVTEGSTSLQAIHALLTSGPEMGLPGFSDFAFGMPEGEIWLQVLHSAMTVSSTAVLPTAPTLERASSPEEQMGKAKISSAS
ncbi:hypothetical protein Taro_011422 [Colocasia esculenta]|uniref:Aminotransferase-like plant mobile domain-containing protein n=1 Tax=Colocasia esculenta TaxID=4460 RepID=A0A843U5W1_COLES|nr:hypothetical protein [Colocasia esculenta]